MNYYDPKLIARVQRRLKALGVRGNNGGWVCVNKPRVRLSDEDGRFRAIRVQGWMLVAKWALEKARTLVEPGEVEVLAGKRYGIPTIDGGRDLALYCLALCAPCPVYLRLGNDAFSLDFNRKEC